MVAEMDFQIRMAVFKWLEEQVVQYGDFLPQDILEHGFSLMASASPWWGSTGVFGSQKRA